MESLTQINLNPMDYVFIGLGLLFTIKGLLKGLSHELAGVVIAVLAICCSLFFYQPVARWIMDHTRLEGTAALVSGFAGSLFVLWLGLKLAGMLIQAIMEMTFTPAVERFGGLFAGFAKATMLTSVVLMTVRLSGHDYLQRHLLVESSIGRFGNQHLPEVYAQLAKVFPALPAPGREQDGAVPPEDPNPQAAQARSAHGL